ncbi:MAG TPA: exodeoxyribonuclease III [Candidatus Acidoferrales bacterium]|nr:exodeoxyribonuclease III [Candidatus Acidoferrales bacterium]
MKIATWNVNGIRARQAELFDWISRDRPDIICLQELKAAPAQIPSLLCEIPDYWCCWHGERAYSGVALQIRKDLLPEPPRFAHPPFDYESRVVTAELGNVVIASLYVPNGGKDFAAKMRFLEELERYVAEAHASGREVILCGDMNVARAEIDVHPKERNPKLIGQRPEERALIERILARGLVDVGRALDPENDRLFTWWAPWRNLRQRNIGWRLDYFFASAPLAERFSSCKVLAEVGTSDHAPVVAEMTLS